MNLHGLAGPVVAAVNPWTPISVRASTGPGATQADGSRVPTFASPVATLGQVQPISTRDLAQLEGINLGGVRWKVYLYGEVDSVVRPELKGGDLIDIVGGRHQGTWLVTAVLEQFPDWCCCAITLQNGA